MSWPALHIGGVSEYQTHKARDQGVLEVEARGPHNFVFKKYQISSTVYTVTRMSWLLDNPGDVHVGFESNWTRGGRYPQRGRKVMIILNNHHLNNHYPSHPYPQPGRAWSTFPTFAKLFSSGSARTRLRRRSSGRPSLRLLMMMMSIVNQNYNFWWWLYSDHNDKMKSYSSFWTPSKFQHMCGTEPFPTDFRAKKYRVDRHFLSKV